MDDTKVEEFQENLLRLNNPDSAVRLQAAKDSERLLRNLDEVGKQKVVVQLIGELLAKREHGNYYIIRFLSDLNAQEAKDAIAPFSESDDVNIRLVAAKALHIFNDIRGTNILVQSLVRPLDADTCLYVSESLGKYHFNNTMFELALNLLKSDNNLTRLGALNCLVASENTVCVEILIKLLDDSDEDIRELSVLGLTALIKEQAIPYLLPKLKDNALEVKANVIVALSDIGSLEVIQNLELLLESEEVTIWDESISDLAEDAIVKIKTRYLIANR